MKAYFLSLGAGAEAGLPALLTAFSCGAAKQPEAVSLLRIPAGEPEPLTDRLLDDLRFCHDYFSGMDAFAFFQTEWESDVWIPRLPGREDLVENDRSRLLLQALRGEGIPFSFRTDPEAVEWSLSSLLRKMEEADSGDGNPVTIGDGAAEERPRETQEEKENRRPFRRWLSGLTDSVKAGEDCRVMLLCDPTEGYAAGLALGMMRFLRERLGDRAPFIGLAAVCRACGAGAREGARQTRDFLSALRNRNLVRSAEGRETAGADACWLLGLPAALMTGAESAQMLDWAAARALGECWTAPSAPAAGIHTREVSGVVTLGSLDQEARPAAAFLRGAFWCLSDLFPSLKSYLEHPALLRSLAPASRGGLFRRLFREAENGSDAAKELAAVERTLRALCLQALRMTQALPAWMKDADAATEAWDQAVRACGRAVTLAAEYDVGRKEAEDSGVDKVMPVHRTSMSDTEEEELIHRLDRMEAELNRALAEREEALSRLGGFVARQALEDCLSKCRTAETAAREKLIQMPAGEPEERYALGLQERRVRMLGAAVARCERDLVRALEWTELSRGSALKNKAAFAGEILEPALAEQAFILLTGEEAAAAEAAKLLRDGIGGVLKGYALNDAKTMLKNLLATCRQPDDRAPLRGLMAGVFSVCGVETSGLRFHSRGDLPAVPLLPDLTEEGRFFTLSAAPEKILAPAAENPTAARRGLLALMLLRQYRRRGLGEAALELVPLEREDSELTRVFLSSRNTEKATLCMLRGGAEKAPRRLPLAILIPGRGPEPARLQAAGMDLVPSFAFWADRENAGLEDPCLYLSDADRIILTQQITRLRAGLGEGGSPAFLDFLSEWHRDIMQAPRQAQNENLPRRLRVVCGLARLPMWQKELHRVCAFYESSLPGDPVCAALMGTETAEAAQCDVREDILYAFRDIPLAREDAHRLLESARAPEEQVTLASLDTECDILMHSSDDYHEALAEGIRELMARYPEADEEAIRAAEEVLQAAQEPLADQVTELEWPWDVHSASVLTILTECLGRELAGLTLRPFCEKLAVFPARGGDILGDVMLSGLCTLQREETAEPEEDAAATGIPENAGAAGVPEEPAVRPDAALPPLRPEFARGLCRSAPGRSLIQPGFLAFRPEVENIRVTLTLEGAFTLRMHRVYTPGEIRRFYAHDLPTLALWPSLPFPAEEWRSYCSFAHLPGDWRVRAVTQNGEELLRGNLPRAAVCQEEYPLCYLLFEGEEPLGTVPNLLPEPEIPATGSWTACLDFGSSATSVVFTDGAGRWPMQGPVTVRTLMRNPAASETQLWQEFLPAVPVSPLLPGALRIFSREVGEEDIPLRDGAIFMSASLEDVLEVPSEALYTDLKWNGERGRALRLYLHQVMLMAALQARCGGAAALGWRTALPDGMAPEGRERLMALVNDLAGRVSRESGIPLPEKAPPAAFLPESTALGNYFRFCSPDQARGGFLTLDLGADTADLSLFLRGRGDAVRSCQLPLGLHNMLLPALLRRPEILREDFGFIPEEGFQRDLAALQALLEKACRDPAALRQARYGLDALIADRLPLLMDALSRRRAAGDPGRTGSLILLHCSFLMMGAGLMLLQIAHDALRNDDLPDTMTLFLAGRGSGLVEAMSLPAKTSLWKLLTMFRNPRVRSMNFYFSAEKKLEIPVGLSVAEDALPSLPRAAAEPAAIAVRPEELMPEFLLRFRREFPAEAAQLFPGVYANDYYAPFTPYGRQLLAQALQDAFGAQEPGRPFPALAACLHQMNELIQEGIQN